MTPADIKNYIKSQLTDAEVIVCGINADQERCIGVYDSRTKPARRVCIGGKDSTTYQTAAYTVLVHWTDNPVAAEAMARTVAALFDRISNITMDGVPVISSTATQPRWAGRAVNRCCEYTFDITINYKEAVSNGSK